MRKAWMLMVALVLPVTPAAAGTADDPEITDPCGDGVRMAQAGDIVVDSPEERSAGFDIAKAWFAEIRDTTGEEVEGVEVSLDLCAAVPATELPGSSWSVSWDTTIFDTDERNCWGSLYLGDFIPEDDPSSVERSAQLVVGCSEQWTDILGRTWSTGYNLLTEHLGPEALSVAGSRITWSLRHDQLSPEMAGMIAPGETLASPNARARDGRRLFSASTHTDVYVASGVEDSAGGGRDFVVGG